MATTLDSKAREIASFVSLQIARPVPVAPQSFLWFLCVAIAALWTSIEKLANRSTRNNLVSTADPDGVIDQGKEFLGREPFPATTAKVRLSFAMNAGSIVPPGTPFTIDKTGLTYTAITGYTAASTGTFTFDALCTTEGSAGNFTDSGIAYPQKQIPGLVTSGTATLTTTAIDAEPIEEYRQKTLDAKRYMGGGGNLWDYRQWGQEVQGVKRIYPYRGAFDTAGNITAGLSHRTIYVQATESINAEGLAPQSLLDSVRAAINNDPTDGTERVPATAVLTTLDVRSIRRTAINVKIYGSTSTWSGDAIAAINAAVQSYLFNLMPYIGGVDPISGRTNDITVVNVSGVVRDAAEQYGVSPSKIELYLVGQSTPFEKYPIPAGSLTKLGTIEYP